jgi:AcrR family transcriptional regulator
METGNLSGRRRQAQVNDGAIRRAAREVFVIDPESPISAVADKAGVGISALYRRYESKDELLKTLCVDGLKQMHAEATSAKEEVDDAWEGVTSYLMGVVEADAYPLASRLMRRFEPTPEMQEMAVQTQEIAEQLFNQAQAEGSIRPDAVFADLDLILASCAAVESAELKQRLLALELDGLSTKGDLLPGSSTENEEG